MLSQYDWYLVEKKQDELFFFFFFIENQKYAKKNLGRCPKFNKCVEKKKNSTPTKLIYKNKAKTNDTEMAESLNYFFLLI